MLQSLDNLQRDCSATHARPAPFSPRSFLFSYKDGCREAKRDTHKIHARVPTRWTNANRPETHPRAGGGLARKERKGERETPTQVGPHTTVSSFVGHRMGMSCSTDTRYTQHCTLRGAVPRRVALPAGRATLWPIACDSNRRTQGEGVGWREEGSGPWHLSARDECDRKRIII